MLIRLFDDFQVRALGNVHSSADEVSYPKISQCRHEALVLSSCVLKCSEIFYSRFSSTDEKACADRIALKSQLSYSIRLFHSRTSRNISPPHKYFRNLRNLTDKLHKLYSAHHAC